MIVVRRRFLVVLSMMLALAARTSAAAEALDADTLVAWSGVVLEPPGDGWIANSGDEALVLYHGSRSTADFIVVSIEAPPLDSGLRELYPSADRDGLREGLCRFLAAWCARRYGGLRRLRRYDSSDDAPAVMLEFYTADELNYHRVYLFLPPTGRLCLLTIRCRAESLNDLRFGLDRMVETLVFQ